MPSCFSITVGLSFFRTAPQTATLSIMWSLHRNLSRITARRRLCRGVFRAKTRQFFHRLQPGNLDSQHRRGTSKTEPEATAQEPIPYYCAAQIMLELDAYQHSVLFNMWQDKLNELAKPPQAEHNIIEDVYDAHGSIWDWGVT